MLRTITRRGLHEIDCDCKIDVAAFITEMKIDELAGRRAKVSSSFALG